MSSSAPQPPDLDRVEKGFKDVTSLTNTLSEFVRWVAGMVRKRQWAELLMFGIAVAVVFWATKLTLAQVVKEPIFYGIWLTLGVVFLVSVILELRKKPPLRLTSRDPGKRKAIKFLSSFEQEDAEIFARLQGYRDPGTIFESIVYPEFSFGILKGRSGCGKSSYLKAGLLAALAKTDAYRGVYIRFSNLDTLDTIREAFVESLKLPKQDIETLSFSELLNKGIDAAAQRSPNFKSLILIFDQFEQFFVYTDDEARREAFIQALANWYKCNDLKEKVKIIVSIREDWFARMDEIQEALNYTLRIGSQTGGNSFYLKNFSAEEAVMILTVMAQEDLGIEQDDTARFDRHYMQDILERELASPTDHLISPVDLQIMAETIKQQNTSEMRAFNRTVLQKLGGIEGLRRSFLEKILEPLGTERKKLAVQVLVALTNLEQQTRAEVQTLAQLQEKLKGSVPPDEVETIADYLQGTGLSSVVERTGIKGYELAHEGMIAAVIRLGGQVQDKAYRANQLLERRVNEWLGNNRSSRYLFNLGELWSIEQQKPYLIWGSKRQQKQQLLAQSKRRIYQISGGFGGVVLLGMGIWGWWNYIPQGQLTQIRWKLANVSQQIGDPTYQSKAAVAFAKDENFPQAFKLANQIQESSDKADALRDIAAAYGQLNQPKTAADLLEKALAVANQIQESYYKAYALRDIAEAIGKLNQPKTAADLLEKASAVANQIQESYYKAYALRDIAEAIDQLNQPETAADLLEKALTAANQIQNSNDKANALRDIAEAIGQLNQPKTAADLLEKASAVANQIQDSDYKANALRAKARALSAIAAAYGQLNQPKTAANLLEKALAVASQIQDSDDKADALRDIAEAIGKLNQPEKATDLLQQTLAAAKQIQNSSDKVNALRAIAEAIGQLPAKAADLQKALAAANQLQDSDDKASAISVIAEAIGQLNQPEKATDLLQQTLAAANQIQNSNDKARALRDIAEAIGKLNQPEKGAPLLEKALDAAKQIQNSSYKVDALRDIAAAIGQLNQPETAADLLQQTLDAANQMQESDDKARALRDIAAAYGQLNQPKTAADLLEKALTVANQIQDSDYKARALSAIAEAIGQLNQPETAADLLQQTLDAANQMQESDDKTDAIIAIAEAISQLNQPETAADLLQQTLDAANQMQESSDKADALSDIAEAEASLKNWGQALKVTQQCPSQDCEVDSLARILTSHAEQQHPGLKEEEEEEF